MSKKHSGSCLCQQVKFEVEGNFDGFFLCHCTHCQKGTGSAHASNLFSGSAKLNWISGQDNVTVFNLVPTRHMKSFCKTCGSGMPNLQMEGKLLVVPAGSLDTKVDIKPTAHIFYASKANWETELDKITKFEKLPQAL